jgi:tetratricopeptide (TPR) repeat protein
MQVVAGIARVCTCFELGEFSSGRAYVEKALALYDPEDRASYAELLPNDVRVQLRVHSAQLLTCLGHFDQASLQSGAALEEARRLSHPPTLAWGLCGPAFFPGWWVGAEPGSLLPYADELLAVATEHGLGWWRGAALVLRGRCLAALGRAEKGITLVTDGVAGWDELGVIPWKPWALTVLGDASRMAGQWQAALDHLSEAQRLSEQIGDRLYQAETLGLRGDVLLAVSDPVTAEASYHEAIALAQEQSAKLWELRTAMSLGRLWRAQGKRAEAHNLLAPVYRWFTEGFGTPVLQQAKALLDNLD